MGTICSVCGYDNAPGLRFCAKCASELANVCPSCGFENPPGFKFCGQCGANIAAAQWTRASPDDLRRLQSYLPSHLVEKMARQSQELRGERRNVTILFTDVSGFTSISERLDPEEVYSIMDELFKSFVEEIYRFEGTVDKFTGDGLMALFGAPIAHEDDSERAIRACLGMQEALGKLNERIGQRLGVRLLCRFGLNAGEVIVGGLGSDLRLDYTVIGDAVNVAARLEREAQPGAILVSETVYQATEPIFDFEWVGDLSLRGREKPVRAYRVLKEKPQKGRTRGIRGLEAPLIGREREIGQLMAAARATFQQGWGQIILLTGEAGLGKSRITAEWKKLLPVQSILVLQANSLSHSTTIGFWAFRELLRNYFGLSEADQREMAREKVEAKVSALLGEEARQVLPYVQNLLSPELISPAYHEQVRQLTPAELRQQTFVAMRDLFAAEARRRPVVLIFEDVHWLDRSSLDLLLFLLSLVEGLPIIFYVISRSDEGTAINEISSLAKQLSEHFVHINLTPLSENNVDRLLDTLLAAPDLPPALREAIPERAEGNPFFLEEIIRMMIERGILIRDATGRWRGMDSTRELQEVPRTLRGLILARVDALAEAPRDVLQCAAVVGRSFPQCLLERVVSTPATLELSLRSLQERGLIIAERVGLETRYTFHHALTQEAIYQTLLKRRRQELHRAVGEAIEQIYAERLEEQIELLAHHFYLGDVADRALGYLIRAGQRAAARYANDEAREYYQRALGLLERTSPTTDEQITLYTGLGDVCGFQGEYDEALAHYAAALQVLAGVATEQVPAWRNAEVLRKTARVWERKGGYEEATRYLERALDAIGSAEGVEVLLERGRAYNDLGWVAFRRGDMDAAARWTNQALALLESTRSWQDIAAAYNRLAGISHQQGDWAGAIQYALRGLELRERIGYTYGIAMSYNNLAVLSMAGGNWEEGIRYAERSMELKLRMGDVGGAGISYNNLGVAYKDKGDWLRAREYLQKALSTAKRTKNATLFSSALNNLGHVALLMENWRDATGYLEESLKVSSSSGSKEQMAEAQWLLAMACMQAGDLERAEQYVEQALTLAKESGSRLIGGLAARTLAELRRRQGRLEEAVGRLLECLELFRELRNQLEVGRTNLLLGSTWAAIGRWNQAIAAAEEASRTFRQLGAMRDDEAARQLLVVWRQQIKSVEAVRRADSDATTYSG